MNEKVFKNTIRSKGLLYDISIYWNGIIIRDVEFNKKLEFILKSKSEKFNCIFKDDFHNIIGYGKYNSISEEIILRESYIQNYWIPYTHKDFFYVAEQINNFPINEGISMLYALLFGTPLNL